MIDIYIYKKLSIEGSTSMESFLFIYASERSLFLLDTLIGNEGYDDDSQC